MVAVVLLASVTGTVLPIIAVALNIDPAVNVRTFHHHHR